MTCCALCHEKYGSVVGGGGGYTTTSSEADPIIQQHVYHWIFAKESYAPPQSRRQNIEGWIYLSEYSSTDICVYRRDNNCIVAFRGTQTAQDIYNDIQLSQYGNQCEFSKVRPSVEFIQDLLVNDPDIVIQVTGHSLGGAVARCVSVALQLISVTFNSAAPPSSPKQNNGSETAYHIQFDIISAWQSPCVRIDKGFRPKKTSMLYRMLGNHMMKRSIRPMLDAHNIDNFSNARPGRFISTNEENTMWREWYTKVPLKFKVAFLVFLGTSYFPPLPGTL